MPDIHHLMGPSSASRWLPCPGSLIGPKQVDNRPKDAADEGTSCHRLLEICLSYGLDPQRLIGTVVTVPKWPVTEEMAKAVDYFVDTLKGICAEHGAEFSPETVKCEVYMVDETIPGTDSRGLPLHGGTTDVIVRSNGVLIIGDLKYGRQPVSASSEQLTCYTCMALKQSGEPVHKCVQFIVQPRAINGVTHTVHIPTQEEINRISNQVRENAEQILQVIHLPQAPPSMLQTGSHCKYCPRQTDCPEQLKDLADLVAAAQLGDVTGAEANVERLVYWLDKQEQVEQFFKRVFERLLMYAQSGVKIPGKKLVTRWGNRYLKGADDLNPLLQQLNEVLGINPQDAVEMKPKGVVALEDLIKARYVDKKQRKEKIEEFNNRFIGRDMKGVTLVDLEAKGEEVSANLFAQILAEYSNFES